MQKYELLLILPGTLDDKEVEARSQEIVNIVKEHATGVTIETMGKNRLAYPIKQIRYGYYYAIAFQAEATEVKILERKLSLIRDVLRALISHFNVELSAAQKLAYTQPGTIVIEKEEKEPVVATGEVQQKVAAFLDDKAVEAVPESKVARKVDKLDLDQINKKLDDLMSGDVIPGV